MRAGTRFDEEDYDNPHSDGVLIDEVSGYRTRRHPDLPPDIPTWARTLDNDRPHGSPFKYRSILTDVLAWAAVEATGTRFPDLLSDKLWSRIGAEHDAEVIVDPAGFPAAEGGICTTLRDLARIGLLHLGDGELGGRRVLPATWVQRVRTRDDELIATFADELLAGHPNACYHDCWWVWDPDAGIYSGCGINGQQLLVHRPSRTVIAKFSSWPSRFDLRYARYSDAANVAVIDALT
jgi:CubicO group peptidase (beta-lactamase class C family)